TRRFPPHRHGSCAPSSFSTPRALLLWTGRERSHKITCVSGIDGLFVADRKVADLSQVVETITPNDVSEIWGPVVARGSVLGTILGGWLGFAVGVVPGLGGASDEVAWLVLIGSIAAGSYLGFRWSSHETDGISLQGTLNYESFSICWHEPRRLHRSSQR